MKKMKQRKRILRMINQRVKNHHQKIKNPVGKG